MQYERPGGQALPQRIQFHTRDTDAFVAVINQVFGHHRIVAQSDSQLSAGIEGHVCHSMVVGQLHYGVDVSIVVDQPRAGWVLAQAVAASNQCDQRELPPGDLMTFAPDWCGRLAMRRDSYFRNVFLPQTSIDQTLQQLLGSPADAPLRMTPWLPGHAPQTERMRQLSDLMYHAHAGATTVALSPLVQQSWERMFAMELLTRWPHSYSRYLERPTLLPRSLKRACDYIEAHLDQPITVVDVARAASVGVRALELGFARHLEVSPMRWVRQRRLAAARRDLQQGRGRQRVADIAFKWGFASPGQFARHYRERFGELPSQTLGATVSTLAAAALPGRGSPT